MAEIEVREAVLADLPQIAAVALATGQDEEWGGADPAYMTHLLAVGRVVVGVTGGAVVGFGATRSVGGGADAVSMLSDLFVHPRVHGSGCGRAPEDGLARVCLPAPHPAVRTLLAAAGGRRSSTCSWRPTQACWTRAAPCRPRRSPELARTRQGVITVFAGKTGQAAGRWVAVLYRPMGSM